MSTRTNLLNLLQENQGEFVSGERIGEVLGVSRNSIWKAVDQLKKDGWQIQGKSGSGYCLLGGAEQLSKGGVENALRVPCKLQVHDVVTSTNDLAKALTPSHKPTAIIANKQSAGRGRLNRPFESPGGTGLYMTIALKPDFALDQALFVTMACAVATCRAMEKVCGIQPSIKWVNDLFLGDKKICGILTEAQTNFETGKIDSLIIGTGINCFPGSFSPEISHIAGCISEKPGSFSRSHLAGELINETMDVLKDVESRSFLTEYRQKCFILGKDIVVHPQYNQEGYKARALDISDDGGLIIQPLEGLDAGGRKELHTGEISISL